MIPDCINFMPQSITNNLLIGIQLRSSLNTYRVLTSLTAVMLSSSLHISPLFNSAFTATRPQHMISCKRQEIAPRCRKQHIKGAACGVLVALGEQTECRDDYERDDKALKMILKLT